ncbi:MAG: diacylglycerol kinase family lipid kinase, partial [Betaproteobacteria bacterium]|nr:diacylglycerol kinase family lipid kinase [Betaproteobacteria bacterium]
PHILIIFNPTAGQRKQHLLFQTVRRLLAMQWEVTLKPTHRAGDGIALAAEAARNENYNVVCAAGGDGTINEVVSGLVKAEGYNQSLGIIPLGTANVLANELGYGKTPLNWANTLTSEKSQQVYIGQLMTTSDSRYFICMAGVGFDASVVSSVNKRLKKFIGKGAYIFRTVQLLWQFLDKTYEIKIDDQLQPSATAVVVCNGHFYGGRFVLAPQAKLTEKNFHIVLFSGRGAWAVMRLMLSMVLGRAYKMKDLNIVEGQKLEIHNNAGEPIQADGDNIGQLPATFTLLEKRITVVCP